MNLYISDLHFGHKNCIRFDHRPFADIDGMDRMLIELWNGRVYDDDHVYIIGDFCYRSDKAPEWYLRQLKGHKHLIIGNHDKVTLDSEKAMSYFESVDKLMHVTDTLNGEKIEIVCCHYPIVSWYKGRHGSYHIYGHVHSNTSDPATEIMLNFDKALNAGCMINNYTPASVSELLRNKEEYIKKLRE